MRAFPLRSLLIFLACAFAAPQGSTPAAQDRDDGRAALAAGEYDRAYRILLHSLILEPSHPRALADLAAVADAKDNTGDAGSLWRFALAGALADENGNIKIEGEYKNAIKSDTTYKPITAARAELLKDVARAAEKATSARSLALWLRDLAAVASRPQPALEKKYSTLLNGFITKANINEPQIIQALVAALERALSGSHFEEAARLALALRGLATQAGYKDLMTPAPDLKAARDAANAGLARAREMLKSKEGALPTIESLEQLTVQEREEFTKLHDDPARPGIVNSPSAIYRIETVCGIDTLLSAAKQVEYHHRRIAKWAGSDPFEGRPGIVRIVPRATDLDSEGSPFWWAGGFQAGDITTLHFAHGTDAGLGRGLTHELTHRFDGALFPGMAGWLAEGRAVWTGGAYGNITDDLFVESYASFGAISETYRRGRGTAEYLTKLLTGTIDDYRENYTAGHALWVYLWSWSPDTKIFRPQLHKYLTGLKTQQKPVDWFLLCFADGKGGRPNGMELFAKGFAEFIKGFWWESMADFTKRYVGGVEAKETSKLIYDSPTWHSDRAVAERYFGAAHATDAARLFTKAGDTKNAISAFEWGLSRDELTKDDLLTLAQLYEKTGKHDAAFAVRCRARAAFPGAFANDPAHSRPAPILQLLSSVDARMNNLLKALAEAAEAERSAGHPDTAASLADEYNKIAAVAGKKSLSGFDFTNPASRPAKPPHPICEVPVSLVIHGAREEALLNYDEYRARGLWNTSPGGDVILGRKEFAAQTGQQREAWLAQTFTHGNDYLSGQYTISARVRFLTTYGDGSLVIGYQRHDRNFRVSFRCGDQMYAIGKKDKRDGGDSVWLQFGDLRDREPALPNGKTSARVSVSVDNPSFLLTVDVDGASAHVYANDQYLGTHTAASAAPIEGFVGFASGNGVLQFEQGTYQIHRRAAASNRCGCKLWPDGVDLESKCTNDWFSLVGQRARGFEPGSAGTAIFWVPNLKGINSIAEDPSVDIPAEAAAHFIKLRAAACLESIPVIIAMPETLTLEEMQRMRDQLKASLRPGDKIVTHHGHAGYDAWREQKLEPSAFYDPFLLFVDRNGYIRTRERYKMDPRLPLYFEQWSRLMIGGY